MSKKIGIYGGTFSPIHKAHIDIAKAALSSFDLDEVWLLVSGFPPHKDLEDNVNAFLRVKMCEIATRGIPGIAVKDYECYLNEKSFTYKTLQKLNKQYPDYHFYFIMGEDSIDSFSSWKNPDIISKYTDFIIAVRDSENLEILKEKTEKFSLKYNCGCDYLNLGHIRVSSTDIRAAIKSGDRETLKKYVSNEVIDYIFEHRIYMQPKEYDIDAAIELIKNTQKESRYMHCLRVADTASALASAHLFPSKIAYITGILHDCAKHMSGDELIDFCKKNNLNITKSEQDAPYLLHGLVGAQIAKEKFDIDSEMAHAIEVHTRGCENMSLLDKIIFIADYIEPGRKRSRILEDARIMAYKDLDCAIIMILEDTIEYLKSGDRPVDSTTNNTLKYYKELTGEKNEF